MRPVFIIVALSLLVLASAPALSQTVLGEAAISGQDAAATVTRLADKGFAGRFTGHPGYTNAANWALSRFKEIGLNAALQSYPSPYSIVDGGRLEVTVLQKRHVAGLLTDFMPMLFSDAWHTKAASVFVGWGIHAPELGYDDYARMDVRGKFVLCFRGTPGGDQQQWANHDEHRTRIKVAMERGAVGLIYVYQRVLANPNGDRNPGFLAAMISDSFFDKFLGVEGTTTEALRRQLAETMRPASFPLEATVDLSVKARHFPKGEGYNVVAWHNGIDRQLAKECVVVGAHLDGTGDHFGKRYPGAEDNASGCAVVMEIAKAFSQNVNRNRRSVVFVLFGSEEQGGHGSKFFMDNLPAQFTKVVAFLNLDMVGIGTKANIGISEPMETHRTLLEKSDKNLNIVSDVGVIRTVGPRSGDIVPFFMQKIPLAAISSNGPRPQTLYHQPGDVPGLMQPDILENISRLMFRFAFELCEI
jgi:hypothetical protein